MQKSFPKKKYKVPYQETLCRKRFEETKISSPFRLISFLVKKGLNLDSRKNLEIFVDHDGLMAIIKLSAIHP